MFALVAATASADLVFNRDVRPILSEHCFACHGPDRATREADLRLDVVESALEVIYPGDVDASELVRRIQLTDPNEMMPPPHANKSLSKTQREILETWVSEGAKYQDHWAFIPPSRMVPPETLNDEWSSNPIDRFVLERLSREGLQPSPRAKAETLVRRITLDLTGLPPTPSEVDEFVADN